MPKNLHQIHEDVPADHYDKSIKRNILQRYWHAKRFKEITKFPLKPGGVVLDIGCHSGTFTKKILEKNKKIKIYGIDISSSAIKLIKKRIPRGYFQIADATLVPFKSDFFDTVYCLEALEHIDNPQQVIKEIKRVLKRGGRTILLTPTDNKLFKIIWFFWTLFYPVWRHAHVNSFTNTSLEKIIKANKLKIVQIKTFHLGMLKIIVAEK